MNRIDATTGEIFALPEFEVPTELELRQRAEEIPTCADCECGCEEICQHHTRGEQ